MTAELRSLFVDGNHCDKCPLVLRAVCMFHGCHEAKVATIKAAQGPRP